MMKNIYLFLILICACTSQSERKSYKNIDNSEEISVKDDEKEEKKESIKIPLLTYQNAKKELSKFGKANPETIVLMKTSLGDIKIKLYEDTPLHRANFLQLVKQEYFNGTVFYRVVKDMIIQAGNLDDRSIKTKRKAIGAYRIPAEFKPSTCFHKKGVLASPRRDENNPEKSSHPFEFYIVQGGKPTIGEIQAFARQNNIQYTPQQVQTYTQIGGLPHLDNNYTVFGEVIEGLEVVDKIGQVKVDKSDNWPLKDIFIEDIEVIE